MPNDEPDDNASGGLSDNAKAQGCIVIFGSILAMLGLGSWQGAGFGIGVVALVWVIGAMFVDVNK